ncbi:MAG: outer membrane protein assembly factor BamD [Gammaproteobacteria bacterium]|nr:outer membrane protein assembly factor BamD [Gammaproteobacteria bacterium]
MRLATIVLILAGLLGGCGLLPEQIDETKDWSAQRLYSEAKEAMNDADWEKAIDLFEKLEARYPFGRYAQQALLESAYAYYKFDEPESATAAVDRFLKTYPRHPHTDYAYYLRGLVNFNRGDTLVDRFLPRDPAERDAGAARQAFFDFGELVKQFPDSRYAQDAGQRMVFLRGNLARYEMHVADYYMRRGAYVAAANRAKQVIESYQGTPAVPEALEILVRAYRRLGLEDLAADAERVLQLNYPERAARL